MSETPADTAKRVERVRDDVQEMLAFLDEQFPEDARLRRSGEPVRYYGKERG